MAGEELKIGELAKRLGLNPRTIRFYEDAGVLPEPARSAGGYRVYTARDEQRLRFIKAAQRVGLKLGEIKEVLCSYVADLIDARLAEVDERMRDLRTLKRELAGLQHRIRQEGAEPGEGRFCHYIETSSRD